MFDAAHGNAIRIQDVDAGGGQLLVTLSADHGLLRLSRVAGLTFMNGTANGSATLTFTGTLADINAALDGLVYEAAANYVGPATLRIVTDDQGNSGSGGALSATSSIAIAVTPSDVTPPSATLTLADALLAAGQSTRLTIRFSEAIQSLDASAFTLPGGTLAGLSSTDGGLTWTATYTPAAGADLSNAVIALDLRQVRDLAGNAGSGSALSGALRIDTQPPASPALNLEQRALDPSGGLLSGNGVLRVDGLESGGTLAVFAGWRRQLARWPGQPADAGCARRARGASAAVGRAGNVSTVSSLSFSVQGQVPPYVHPTPPPGTLLPPLAPPVASLSPVADARDEFLPSLGGAQAGSRSPAHASPLAWAMDEHGARQAPRRAPRTNGLTAAVYAPQRIGASDAPGQELVVLRGLTTLALEPGAALDLRIPSSVFGHTRADARIQLSLTLEDGRALPAWIRFDARSSPPAGGAAARLRGRDCAAPDGARRTRQRGLDGVQAERGPPCSRAPGATTAPAWPSRCSAPRRRARRPARRSGCGDEP
ncbi:Ig-like domain-containing protein [Achromobacter xylosoxidans]